MIPHIINANGTISLMLDGNMKPIDTAHKNYEEIKQALIVQDWDKIPTLVKLAEQVEKAINSSSASKNVKIVDGEVLYNGEPIHNTLTARILEMSQQGFDIAHMVKFLDNLMQNPSYRATNELYDFLEAGKIPITENGTFLTYKKIKSDWTDIYTGKIDNSIGAEVSMPRNKVNEDSSQTCSTGLHVCSYDYLPHFGSANGDRVVICEVNPKDVVSIPTDYNNTKMRCCRYKVVGEVEDYNENNILASKAVVNTNDISDGVYTGTANTNETKAKEIGKMIEKDLNEDRINNHELVSILRNLGTSEEVISEINDHIFDREDKRVGKKIAKLITLGVFSSEEFLDEHKLVMIDYNRSCCDETEDEVQVCPRCNSSDVVNGECQDCGYFI